MSVRADERIELEILRVANEQWRADPETFNRDCPFVHPRRDDTPDWAVRVGSESKVVLCRAQTLLGALMAMPDSAPIGSPGHAPPGSVWHALLVVAHETAVVGLTRR